MSGWSRRTRSPTNGWTCDGHDVRVEFGGFLRPQVKFDSADALKDELTRNVQETRELTSAR